MMAIQSKIFFVLFLATVTYLASAEVDEASPDLSRFKLRPTKNRPDSTPHFGSQRDMVAALKASRDILTAPVESAMLKVDRAHFCTARNPYEDSTCSIGYGAKISAPHMDALALELLKFNLGDHAKILDIGSGSGYLTACLAHIAGPDAVVYGVEHIPELVKQAEDNVRKAYPQLLSSGRVRFIHADARAGLAKLGPFDAIHVGATIPDTPWNLLKQLKMAGIIVYPVERFGRHVFEKVMKIGRDKTGDMIDRTEYASGVDFEPLTDVETQLRKH